jgi:hypothetical protein
MTDTIGPGYYRIKVSEKADERLVRPLVSEFVREVSSAIKVASNRSRDDAPAKRRTERAAEG